MRVAWVGGGAEITALWQQEMPDLCGTSGAGSAAWLGCCCLGLHWGAGEGDAGGCPGEAAGREQMQKRMNRA